MTEPLRFHFTLTSDDYVKAVRLYYRHDRTILVAIGALAILAMIGVYFSLERRDMLVPALMGILIYTLVTFGYLFLYQPLRLARRAEKNQRLRTATAFTMDEEQVYIKTVFGEATEGWAAYGRSVEGAEHFLLFYAINPRVFHIIPRRAFETPAMEASFRDLLRRKLAKQPAK